MTHPHAQDGPQWIEFSPAQDEPESRFFKPPTGKCPAGGHKIKKAPSREAPPFRAGSFPTLSNKFL